MLTTVIPDGTWKWNHTSFVVALQVLVTPDEVAFWILYCVPPQELTGVTEIAPAQLSLTGAWANNVKLTAMVVASSNTRLESGDMVFRIWTPQNIHDQSIIL
jgi:hypothetical protein